MNRKHLFWIAVLLLLALEASAAAQQVGIILAQPTLVGAAGTTLTFDATLTNLSSSTIFLNGDSSITISPGFVLSDNPFLNNAPLSLAPGESSGPYALFALTIAPGTAAGLYALNDFTILGGLTDIDFNPVGSSTFTVDVSPVPEPGTLLLVGSGLTGLVVKRRYLRQFC